MIAAPGIDQASATLCWYWHSKLSGEHLERELGPGERDILRCRLDTLEAAFTARDPDLLAKIAKCLNPWKAWTSPYAYLTACSKDIAAAHWAVAGAAERVTRGEIPKPEQAPTPGRFRLLAWGIQNPFWIERTQLRRILTAKPPRAREPLETRMAVVERIRSSLAAAGFHNGKNPRNPQDFPRISQACATVECKSDQEALSYPHNALILEDF